MTGSSSSLPTPSCPTGSSAAPRHLPGKLPPSRNSGPGRAPPPPVPPRDPPAGWSADSTSAPTATRPSSEEEEPTWAAAHGSPRRAGAGSPAAGEEAPASKGRSSQVLRLALKVSGHRRWREEGWPLASLHLQSFRPDPLSALHSVSYPTPILPVPLLQERSGKGKLGGSLENYGGLTLCSLFLPPLPCLAAHPAGLLPLRICPANPACSRSPPAPSRPLVFRFSADGRPLLQGGSAAAAGSLLLAPLASWPGAGLRLLGHRVPRRSSCCRFACPRWGPVRLRLGGPSLPGQP